MTKIIICIVLSLFHYHLYSQENIEVDKHPEFPGGQEKLLEYLGKLTTPPNVIKSENIYTSLIIDTNGQVTDVNIINKSENQALNDSIVKHIVNMPDWVPGENNGKKVAVQYVIPYKIELPNKFPQKEYISNTKEEEEEKVFSIVDKRPEFPGGGEMLIRYMSNLVSPPNIEKEEKFLIYFQVDTLGKVLNVSLDQESENKPLNDSIINHVKNMPTWKPGEINGKKVITQMKITHRIKLSEDEKQQKQIEKQKPEIFTVSEKMPEFLGGEEALLTYLSNASCTYDLKEDVVIYVRFLIDTLGRVNSVKLAKENNLYGLNFCVLDHVRDMPDWSPGMQNGKNVMVEYVVPIRFKANTSERRKRKKRR